MRPSPNAQEPEMDQGISTEPVGYKRPPRARRWKPGQSGNPKGRPPGSGVTDAQLMVMLKTARAGDGDRGG